MKTIFDESADSGKRSHLGTRGTGNAVATAMSGAALVKSLPQVGEKLTENIKKVKKIGKYDWNTVRRYFKHIQEVTGRNVHQKQIDKLKDALRNKEYKKLSKSEVDARRAEFKRKKNKLIEEWEKETGQEWPRYAEDLYNADGKLLRKAGDQYDAHHIIENQFGGENEWWNMHPARYPSEHQGGIHGTGSPSKELFK